MRRSAWMLLVAPSVVLQYTAAAAELSLKLVSQQLPRSGNGWIRISVADAATGKAVPEDAVVELDSIKTATDIRSIEARMLRDDDGTWGVELFMHQKQLGTYTSAKIRNHNV